VKRECYTLSRAQGQTEEASGVRGRDAAKLERIVPASGRDLGECVRDPRRLVPLPPEWNRREVRRVGFYEQAIARHQPEKVIVNPFLESHYPAERHVPTGTERDLRESVRPGVAVHDTDDAKGLGVADERASVVLGVPRVNDDRLLQLGRQRDLSAECRALRFSRRIVVVVVEAALTDRDGAASQELTKPGNVALLIESGRVMGMDTRGREHKTRILRRAFSRKSRHLGRLSDANDGRHARIAGAGDYRVAVAGEGRVREVGVAVDEA